MKDLMGDVPGSNFGVVRFGFGSVHGGGPGHPARARGGGDRLGRNARNAGTELGGGVRIDVRGRGGEDDDGKVGIEGRGGEAKGLVVHGALEIFWPKKCGRFQGEGFLPPPSAD